MNAELTIALYRDFPLLYADAREDTSRTSMCWGFQCGDGWEPIIRRASEALEAELAQMSEPRPRASALKEKMGSLRIYMTGYTDAIDAIRLRAECDSLVRCEECGAPGELRDTDWLRVRCAECAAVAA